MADIYLPLSVRVLKINRPLPVDVWSEHGVLLLARGHCIESLDQLRRMVFMRPMIRLEDHALLEAEALMSPGVSSPMAGVSQRRSDAQTLRDPPEAWPYLHQRMSRLLLHPEWEADGYSQAVYNLYDQLVAAISGKEDEGLFMLVQMLQSRDHGYAVLNGLLSAVICHMATHFQGDREEERRSLCCAALTMNIAIASLQDQLSQQSEPLNDWQQEAIARHPTEGVQLLRSLGVEDLHWLRLVADHHETPDGKGYPAGKKNLLPDQMLIHLADRLVARITPRGSRAGMPPPLAVREVYQASSHQNRNLAELLVRVFGLYPPGSYVKLKSHETAVVVRRGKRINHPKVLAVLNRHEEPIGLPPVRDTDAPEFQVIASIPAEKIRLRLDPRRILQRA